MQLALRQPDALPAAEGDWLPTVVAAPMLGCSMRHLTRLCETKYEGHGLAKRDGDKWLVHRLADDRLRTPIDTLQRDLGHIAELRAAKVSPAFIELAEARRNIVAGFAAYRLKHRNRPADEVRRLYIGELMSQGLVGGTSPVKKLKPRAFINWCNAYDTGGLSALVPAWGGNQAREESIGPEAWRAFMQFIRTGHAKRAKDAYRLVKGLIFAEHAQPGDAAAWKWPHYRTVLRAYAVRISEPERVLHEEGPHKFRAKCLPKIARSLEDYAAGSHFCGDVRTFDFMARVPNGAGGWKRTRLKLTAWLDVRSRYLVGWCIADEANSDTILSAFKSACLAAETIPDAVTIDNGKDYRSVGGRGRRVRKWDEFDSKRVFSAFERLGVEVYYALVRHPWSKIIEPWFPRVKDRFDKWFPSWWGGKTDERPWDAERWTREHIQLLPTTLDVEDAFGEWLAGEHEQIINGDGMFGLCPRQAMRQYFTAQPRKVHADVLALACTKMGRSVKVTANGVRHNNIWYGKHDPEVWQLMGREVSILADPVEADRVTLCDDKGIPICIAYADRNLGQSQSEVRAAMKMKRNAERITAKYPEARDIAMSTPMERIARLRAAAAKSEQIPDADLPPPAVAQTFRVVRPDMIEAAARVNESAQPAIKRMTHQESSHHAGGVRGFLAMAAASSEVPEEEQPRRRIDIRELAAREDEESPA